jgi:Rrf2 family iron-sulfur cluster assembly transcriptional regulator
MKLTTKGRYAVTAMLDVAMHSRERPVALADVSERQHLSLSYLEQLFSRLRRRGLVKSVRGPGGGYRLGRGAEEITVADIILAVDEPVDVTRCGGKGNCHRNSRCLTHDLWTELSNKLQDFLSARTLADVLHRHQLARAEGDSGPTTVIEAGKKRHRTFPIAAVAAPEATGDRVG